MWTQMMTQNNNHLHEIGSMLMVVPSPCHSNTPYLCAFFIPASSSWLIRNFNPQANPEERISLLTEPLGSVQGQEVGCLENAGR